MQLPYNILENKEVVQKYWTIRIIPWDKIKYSAIPESAKYKYILRNINHFESFQSSDELNFLIASHSNLGSINPNPGFQFSKGDARQGKWGMPGDFVSVNLRDYIVTSILEGRQDYLVLVEATEADFDTSNKPFFPGNNVSNFQIQTNSSDSVINLAEYKGKYVLINFWGTWCKPCLELTPNLQQLYKNMDKEKLGMIGINCEFPPENHSAFKYVLANNIEWPQGFEFIDKGNTGLLKTSQVSTFPTLILIDESGLVIKRSTTSAEAREIIAILIKSFPK